MPNNSPIHQDTGKKKAGLRAPFTELSLTDIGGADKALYIRLLFPTVRRRDVEVPQGQQLPVRSSGGLCLRE